MYDLCVYHMETWTKWTIFCRHFQIQFLEIEYRSVLIQISRNFFPRDPIGYQQAQSGLYNISADFRESLAVGDFYWPFYTLRFNEVERGGILVSPCPSVHLWTESCLLCIFNNTRRIHFIFAHLIKPLQKACNVSIKIQKFEILANSLNL